MPDPQNNLRSNDSLLSMDMRSLLITDNPPVLGLREKAFGSYHRLRTFVQAIADICNDIEILHFVNADEFHTLDQNATTSIQAANWETSVKISIEAKNVATVADADRSIFP